MVEIDPKDGLAIQDLSQLDLDRLAADTPEVISRQPTINIGTIGHVAHGKSTVVKALSFASTVRYKKELERNITIKLGYSNAKIYKAIDENIQRPDSYTSGKSDGPDIIIRDLDGVQTEYRLIRHVSFVDCPGHDVLMATMLNGAAVMDAAFLLVASNETCPQPQTKEHLAAIEIMKLKKIIILQNKIDLITKEQAEKNFHDIKKFVTGGPADGSPIIPISAQLKYNIDVICEYIANYIPLPLRDYTQMPQMIVIRSFDVNKPGCEVDALRGGVCGGSIIHGVMKLGQEIEVRPGVITRTRSGDGNDVVEEVTPTRTRVMSLKSDSNELKFAIPGGLIAVGTKCDPTLTRADRMIGQVAGIPGHLPPVFRQVEIRSHLMSRLLGVQTDERKKKEAKIKALEKGETLMFNIGSLSCGGRILGVKDNNRRVRVNFERPVCTEEGEKVAISRRVDRAWRLIGWGEIKRGAKKEND